MLLLKADQDIVVLRKLKSDPEVAVEILGFHAQQASEKMLKAVLAYYQIRFPYTHRLTELIDTLTDQQFTFPQELEEIRYLTPFAVEYRYDFFGVEEEEAEEGFDVEAALDLLDKLKKWVLSMIDTRNSASDGVNDQDYEGQEIDD
jgi:HEPN domain-containing protein